MSVIEEKLVAMGLELPPYSHPKAIFVPTKRVGNLMFASGALPVKEGKMFTGQAGGTVDTETAKEAAQYCALNLLAAAKDGLGGDLSKLKSVVKLTIFVNSAHGYSEQHIVAGGASTIFVETMGEAGSHSRSAVGVAQLPFDATVEVEAIFEVE